MNPPLERAVWWVEYVLRHDGAHHLRSPAQDLAGYQLYQVDVVAVLAAGVLAVLYVNLVILRAIIRKLCCKSNKTDETKTKKKAKKND